MPDYTPLTYFLAKITSPKGQSIKFVKSASNAKIEYTADAKEAGSFALFELKVIRRHLVRGATIEKLNPNLFVPSEFSIKQILSQCSEPVQPDMFGGVEL